MQASQVLVLLPARIAEPCCTWIYCRLRASHTCTMRSPPPTASMRPSSLTATASSEPLPCTRHDNNKQSPYMLNSSHQVPVVAECQRQQQMLS